MKVWSSSFFFFSDPGVFTFRKHTQKGIPGIYTGSNRFLYNLGRRFFYSDLCVSRISRRMFGSGQRQRPCYVFFCCFVTFFFLQDLDVVGLLGKYCTLHEAKEEKQEEEEGGGGDRLTSKKLVGELAVYR